MPAPAARPAAPPPRLSVIRTCPAYPEEYALLLDGRLLGHVHLRGGVLTALSPVGRPVLTVRTGAGGQFRSMAERRVGLSLACAALLRASD